MPSARVLLPWRFLPETRISVGRRGRSRAAETGAPVKQSERASVALCRSSSTSLHHSRRMHSPLVVVSGSSHQRRVRSRARRPSNATPPRQPHSSRAAPAQRGALTTRTIVPQFGQRWHRSVRASANTTGSRPPSWRIQRCRDRSGHRSSRRITAAIGDTALGSAVPGEAVHVLRLVGTRYREVQTRDQLGTQ